MRADIFSIAPAKRQCGAELKVKPSISKNGYTGYHQNNRGWVGVCRYASNVCKLYTVYLFYYTYCNINRICTISKVIHELYGCQMCITV